MHYLVIQMKLKPICAEFSIDNAGYNKFVNNFAALNHKTNTAAEICYSNSRLSLLSQQAKWRQIRKATGKLIDEFIIEAYKKLFIDLLVQCGANEPTSALQFCGIKPSNEAICFEANPYVAEKFNNIPLSSNVKYFNLGLGHELGKLNFYIPKNHPKAWTLQGTFTPAKHLEYLEPIKVPVDKLDNLLPPIISINQIKFNRFPAISLLIDVEGFSWNLLQGSKNILRLDSIKLIFIEVQNENFYWDSEKNAYQITEYLESFNFVPVVRDYPTAQLYNMVFVKKQELHHLTKLIDSYWLKFSLIKPGMFESKDPKFYASKLKKILLVITPTRFHKSLHRFLAYSGSKSSLDFE